MYIDLPLCFASSLSNGIFDDNYQYKTLTTTSKKIARNHFSSSRTAIFFSNRVLLSFYKLLHVLEHLDVPGVLVGRAVLAEVVREPLRDPSLVEHVHEEVVQLPVKDVPGHGVVLLRPLALVHRDFVNREYVLESLFLRLPLWPVVFMNVRAGERQCFAAFLDVHLKVRPR